MGLNATVYLYKLQRRRRRAFKIITGGIVRTPTNNLYNEIGMETLKVRRERNVLLFFFKIIHNMVPSYLQELKPDKKKSERNQKEIALKMIL